MNNSIYFNSQFGILVHNNSGFLVQAINNYWANPSGPNHPETNYQSKGDNISNDVLFEPWLDDQENLVYLPEDEYEPIRIPLYVLFCLLMALFSALAITVITPRLSSNAMSTPHTVSVPSLDSSDGLNINTTMITCEHCHHGFDVSDNENAIRVPCSKCGKDTIK